MTTRKRTTTRTMHPLSEAAAIAGLSSGGAEVVLRELGSRNGLVLSTDQLMERTDLARNTVTLLAHRLEADGLAVHVGHYKRSFTWAATQDGYALVDLLRQSDSTTTPTPHLPPTVTPAAEPEPVVGLSRDTKEHAIWQWCWQLTRPDLRSFSHATIDELHKLLSREGLL